MRIIKGVSGDLSGARSFLDNMPEELKSKWKLMAENALQDQEKFDDLRKIFIGKRKIKMDDKTWRAALETSISLLSE